MCGLDDVDGERGAVGHAGVAFFVFVVAVVIWIADGAEVSIDPAAGAFKLHLAPLLEVVHAAAGEEDDARGRVALILLEVEKEAQGDDSDELEEVDVEIVRLRAIGLPEQRGGGMAELGNTAAGLGAGYGP